MTSITAFRLVSTDAAALADFYRDALGFTLAADGRLLLGPSRIELGSARTAYPADVASNDTRFQHLAIIVADMAQAYAALAGAAGWSPISLAGPERLPATSGGAEAFKFRDPDGHPLELLCFAPGTIPPRWAGHDGLFLGIDHSAIAVANAASSLAFYGALGFRSVSRQTNSGSEQGRLDGLSSQAATQVEVIGLRCGEAGPHLELLAYAWPDMQPATATTDDNAAATVIVMAGADARDMQDPDGHRLAIRAPA